MSYQNINQYNFKRLYLKPLNEVTDISLASDEKSYDEEVIFSPYLIAEYDGNRMPLKFDFNSSDTLDCINCNDFDREVVVSENYWNPLDQDLENCGKITEICDVGLTGIDNGLVKNFSGETIELNSGLYLSDADKFSRYKYDRRFKMHNITGFTTPENRILDDDSYSYDVSVGNDGDLVGNYLKFDGGFYQGFYKSFGYDYQVLPERYHLGWSAEFMLRYRWTGDTSLGLSARYPENKGTFFFYGTRAENKFYHYAAGHPSTDTGYTRVTEYLNCLQTCGCEFSANTASTCHQVYQQSGSTSQNCSCGYCPCNCTTTVLVKELNPLYDGVSNAMSFRLSGDTGSPRLCVKTYKITGGCETTGTCVTGITYTTGTSVTEWCSTRGIFDDCSGTTYDQIERWVQIDAVFERAEYFDDCDLVYKGGLGEIVTTQFTATSANNSVSLIEPPITSQVNYDPPTVEVVNITERWVDEKKYRNGDLKFYVNGKLFLVVLDFEEIIPRPLNTSKETQIGVAYNISLGGGTQGLHDNLTLTGCNEPISGFTYQQDPECLTTETLDQTEYSGLTTHIKLEEYFGGNFFGDISAFRMYSEPLNAGQIIHNFKKLKNRYSLLDPFCLNCETGLPPLVTPTPTITPTNTPTKTATPTPTTTPTNTQTPTNTPTTSITPTQTPTQTNTPTTSITPTITQTPTNTQTTTTTITPTLTPTNTSSETATPTPTNTETPTNTPTNTNTPTTTTPTLTQTPTNTITPTQSATSNIVSSGLVIQLDAYESSSYPGTGTTVFDITSGYNHTLIGATYTVLNGIKCFDCTTGNNRVNYAATGPLLPNSGYTYITWARLIPSNAGFRTLLYTSGPPKITPITIPNASNELGYWATGFVSSGYDVSSLAGVWVQFAVVGTNTSQTFYINGTEVGDTINQGAGGTTHWGWGNNDIVTQPWGHVANMYFYNRQLNLAEITQQYNYLAPRFVEPTSTPTTTSTPTITPTQTLTQTVTETPTQTPTNTSSETPTQTPTNTATPTQTPTVTPTQTPTVTPTSTQLYFLLFEDSSIATAENNDNIEIDII